MPYNRYFVTLGDEAALFKTEDVILRCVVRRWQQMGMQQLLAFLCTAILEIAVFYASPHKPYVATLPWLLQNMRISRTIPGHFLRRK
jgi:hypothetical protein